MFNWIYVIATGEWLYGGPFEVVPVAGQGVAVLSRNPKPRTERHDGTGGIRPATTQEITDFDAARKTKADEAELDTSKLARLVFEINFDHENRLRVLESRQPVTKVQYRNALLNLLRGL